MLEPITAGLFRLYTPFFGIPLYLYVISGEQAVLIDSGIATTPEEFVIPALDAAQLTPGLLICTHGHVDHFGGNAALRARYPALRIAIHEADVAWAEDHERHLFEMYMCMPRSWQYDDGGQEFLALCGPNCAIDVHLRDGQQLDLGDFRFTVVHSAGHCPGHIMLHDPRRGVVICGDVALGWGAIVPGQPVVYPYYYDPVLYLAGIEEALALHGEIYCTGHSGVLSYEEMKALAEKSVDAVRSLERWSLEALDRQQPRSLTDVAHRAVEHLPGYEVGFHLHASTQAHLLKQCGSGRARAVMVGGHKHYLAV
jgi:glyoxylase-like metal-dependent hydrolase (beta-lactamase superfamily II)